MDNIVIKLEYILKILYYFILVFSMYKVAKKYKNSVKFPIICIVLFSVLFGIYAIICGKYPHASDRKFFAFTFEDDTYQYLVNDGSLGLYWVECFLHLFTHNSMWLFFTIGFLYMFLTLIAYKMHKKTEPYFILILGMSAYLSYGCYLLKQCMAIAFIALAFAAISHNKRKLFIIFTIIAILFHEVAWVTIPIYLALHFSKNKKIKILIYIFLIAMLLGYPILNKYLVKFASGVIPGMEGQLQSYVDEGGSIKFHLNVLTALKGIPFYIITIYALKQRNKLKEKIEKYDNYLLMSVMLSVLTLLSSFMYWMYRFATLLYFPVFIFYVLILKEIKIKKERIYFKLGTIYFLAFFTIRMWYQYYFWYGGV